MILRMAMLSFQLLSLPAFALPPSSAAHRGILLKLPPWEGDIRFVVSKSPPGVELIWTVSQGKDAYAFLLPETMQKLSGHPVQNEKDIKTFLEATTPATLQQHGILRFVVAEDASLPMNSERQRELIEVGSKPASNRCEYSGPELNHVRQPPEIAVTGILPPYPPKNLKAYWDQSCQKYLDRNREAKGPGQACYGSIKCGSAPPRNCFCDVVTPTRLQGEQGKRLVPSTGRCPSADECAAQCDSGKSHSGFENSVDSNPGTPEDSFFTKSRKETLNYLEPPVRIGTPRSGLCLGRINTGEEIERAVCLTYGPHCPSALACMAQACVSREFAGYQTSVYSR